MKKSVGSWQLGGFVFVGALGTFLHFLFDLSGENVVAGLISAVNESVWEHMKLLFYPMVLFGYVEWRIWGKGNSGFWTVKLMGVVLGLLLVPVLYYTYTGALGVSADWFNITIFFIAAAVAFWTETKLFQRGWESRVRDKGAVLCLVLIGAVFTVLTFVPPQIPLFCDPSTGGYGI